VRGRGLYFSPDKAENLIIMKLNRKIHICLPVFYFLCFLPVLPAQNGQSAQAQTGQDSTGNQNPLQTGRVQDNSKVDLNITFYNKKIYYPGSEPVWIQVTIANKGADVYRFRLAEDREFSVDFDTRTLDNRKVKAADSLGRRRAGAGKVFYRDIAVESGESFSFVVDLKDYSDVNNPGSYIVRLNFYPQLMFLTNSEEEGGEGPAQFVSYSSGGDVLTSNRLALHINPALILGEDGVPVALDIATGAELKRAKLPPDEVVQWTLTSRQRAQWEKYFLYLDLEKMISRDGERSRRWRAESEEGRQRMLANYRLALQQSRIDGDISAVPSGYTIENTNYNSTQATVVALEKFQIGAAGGGYTELKRYTYYLEKESGYWMIVDYTVTNLGIE